MGETRQRSARVDVIGDVECLRLYREIRRAVPASALRIGEGRNLHPPPLPIVRCVRGLFDRMMRSARLTDYESDADQRERRLVAHLLSAYSAGHDVSEDDIVFTAGAQEAISQVYAWACSRRLSTVLPLPSYFSFEQSAR